MPWLLLPAPARRWGPRGGGGWRGRSVGRRMSLEQTAASRRAGRHRRPACSCAAPPLGPASAAWAPPAAPAPLLLPETLARTAAAAPQRRSSPLLPATGNKAMKWISTILHLITEVIYQVQMSASYSFTDVRICSGFLFTFTVNCYCQTKKAIWRHFRLRDCVFHIQ